MTIESLDDPRVDVYRNVRDADLRGRDKLFMAESELVIRRLLRTPERLHSLFLSPNKYETLKSAIAVLPDTVPVYIAEIDLISEIAGFHIHRGVLAAGHRPTADQTSLHNALQHVQLKAECVLLLAEGITNVDNIGALFRNAAAFDVDGIVFDPTCGDPLYRKAIRVSMGHALSIPYAVSTDWNSDFQFLKDEWNFSLIGLEHCESARPLWEVPRAARVGYIFGSEGQGLSETALAHCDHVCEIPMANEVPSINVAVASAVCLYEHRRNK